PVASVERPVGRRLPPAPAAGAGRATAPAAPRSPTAAPGSRGWAGSPSSPEAMTAIIEQFGILGVFALMVPESACIPVPSEETLLFSGFAVSQGWMSFWLAVLAATAGNLVGALIAYGI